MDRERVRQWESQCTQEQAPACNAACPVHVDVRKLVQCVRKEDFKGGVKVFANAIVLPQIIARICDHPCHQSCRRREAGETLNVSALERACVEYGGAVPDLRRLSAKHQRVAVVGGGVSGVVAALDLGAKGYEVTIFEATGQLLGRLRGMGEDLLPARCIEKDLELLERCEVTVQCSMRISNKGSGPSLSSVIEEHDAVYVGCGEEFQKLNSLNGARLTVDPVTYATSHPKLFAGGTLRYSPAKFSPITSLQDGRYAALSIDRFLQGASLSASREVQGSQPSRLYMDTSGYPSLPQVTPSSPINGYTREEAVQEAERCFPCSCMECVKVCEYLKEFGSYPKRYVREIYNNLCIVMGVRNKNRMINSCSLCGLCEAVCPEKMSMADVCLDARKSLVAAKKMPVSAHEFALRDMAFSTGESFAMARHQPGFTTSAALFFPGCQLAASSPEHVQSCYEFLCETHEGGVGLVLNCCGAPALWAGRNDVFEKSIQALDAVWQQMGQPRIITACSSCYRTLKQSMPQMKIESLWPHLNREKLSKLGSESSRPEYAIHDPCATRGVSEVEDGARHLLQQLGVQPKELNERGLTTCCGYGGLARFVNPELVDKTVARRARQSDADYVTYCAMCRDSFARQGKRALHVLDLVFDKAGEDAAARPDPGFSRRQENRAHLKTRLLRELWGEEGTDVESSIKLLIPDEVKALMERRMILVEDVRKTVEHAEQSGEKIKHPGNGRWLACHRPSCVTYWVEYTAVEGAFQVYDAYFHRMQVR
jgi:Fe-S oxidoreductase